MYTVRIPRFRVKVLARHGHLQPPGRSRRALGPITAASLLFASLVSHGATAHATSVQQFNLAQMFAQSALVVRAHVLEGSGYARDMGRDGVCTELRLEVLEVFAGTWNPSDQLAFCLPGGVTDAGKMQMVLGAPMPQAGETYVLFIKGGPWSYTPFVNWFYGALREHSLQGETVLITGSGDCVLSASNAYLELGARLSQEDQVRHLSSLGVDVSAIRSSPSESGTLAPEAVGGSSTRSEPPTQCATSRAIMASLRARASARPQTQSLSAQAPLVEAFHTQLPTVSPTSGGSAPSPSQQAR